VKCEKEGMDQVMDISNRHIFNTDFRADRNNKWDRLRGVVSVLDDSVFDIASYRVWSCLGNERLQRLIETSVKR
jgi:hypothetical protein